MSAAGVNTEPSAKACVLSNGTGTSLGRSRSGDVSSIQRSSRSGFCADVDATTGGPPLDDAVLETMSTESLGTEELDCVQ